MQNDNMKKSEVKLSVGDYNRLYMFALYGNSYLHCREDGENIVLVTTPSSNAVISHIKRNTKAGEILSHYTNCLLNINCTSEGNVYLYNVCMDEYADCDNCRICGYCTYKCQLGIDKKLEKLKQKIEDIHFVDPIPNRNFEMVKLLEEWSKRIISMKNDFVGNIDAEIQEICSSIEILKKQLNSILDKWEYEKKEYAIKCEAAKNKYLTVTMVGIEDVRRDGAKVAYFEELDEISHCIIMALKTRKIDIVPEIAPFSKVNLIRYACEKCNCESIEVEKTIQRWIEDGLMYETNLGNIGMHVLFG